MAGDIKNNFSGKDILSLSQFDTSSISTLFKTTDKLIAKMKRGGNLEILKGRVITLLFFEPSSRTFGSFMAAAKRLGAETIDIQNAAQTGSFVKGETLEDAVRVFEAYSDLIILRHPEKGSAKRASDLINIPLINGGDGPGDHPTQTLYDLYTIYKRFGKLSGLKIVAAGDPLHSRTIKSLAKGLSLYGDNTLYVLSPEALRMKSSEIQVLQYAGLKIIEINNENDIPKDAHVWYWNRVQKERFSSESEYKKHLGKFILTPKLLKEKGNNHLIILDPLPRVEEIDPTVDADPRALYLSEQLKNGLHVRMAILALVLGGVR